MEVWLVVEPGFRLRAAHFSTSTFSTLPFNPSPSCWAGAEPPGKGVAHPRVLGPWRGGSCWGPGLFSMPEQHIWWIKFSFESLPPEPSRPLPSRPDYSKS